MTDGLKDKGISRAAREAECAEGTLRRLEKRGVINPLRDSGGRRLFSNDDVAAARAYLANQRSRATA
jgi:DNA-binding transcriptional MerR regulator